MGNRKEITDAVEIPKKKRLLDLKSVYKSGELRAVKRKCSLERGGDSGRDDHDTKKKKKKITRSDRNGEVYGASKNSKSLNEVYSNGIHSVSEELSNGSNGGSGRKVNAISASLVDVSIPRRKRGYVHRRKFDGENSHLERLSSDNNEIAHQSGELLLNDSGNGMVCASHVAPDPPTQSQKVKRKKESDGDQALKRAISSIKDDSVDEEVSMSSEHHNPRDTPLKVKQKKGTINAMENNPIISISDRNLNDDSVVAGLNNDNAFSSQSNCNRNKRKKSLVKNGSISVKASESIKNAGLLQKEGDENLEENAARMLSSRFDTSPIDTNGLSLSSPSGRNFNGSQSPMADWESAAGDSFERALRPRKQHEQKHYSRPRRHFYEMIHGDLYTNWVVNHSIKVFWPLDKSWYQGLVDDYDALKKLHHVKYDDRDEEWIDLQNERFQLLLYPSQVSGKTEIKTPILGARRVEREISVKAFKYESVPIISRINRSTNHQLMSSFVPLKKQKTCTPSHDTVPPVPSNKIVNEICLGTGHSKRVEHKSSKVASSEGTDYVAEVNSLLRKTSPREEVKNQNVYFRRRLRQKSQESANADLDVNHETEERYDNPLEGDDRRWTVWNLDDSGLLRLTISAELLGEVRFVLSFPLVSMLHHLFQATTSWLFNAHLLFTHDSVVMTWPAVHLEMLFVDNAVGLLLFVFEGCLKQAVAFVFVVLKAFHQQTENGKYIDLQMPATSFRVKLSCIHDPKKQVVFAFSNFSKVEISKWLYLEVKLKAHSLSCKKLPLGDCSYDNIKAIQSGYNQLHLTSVYGEPSSTEVLQNGLKKASNETGGSRKSTCKNALVPSPRRNVRHRGVPAFSISFTAVPSFFIGLHLKLLKESGVASMNIPYQDSIVTQNPVQSTTTTMLDVECPFAGHNSRSSVLVTENGFATLMADTCSGKSYCSNSQDREDALAGGSGVDLRETSQKCESSNHNIAKLSSSCSLDATNKDSEAIIQVQKQGEVELVSRHWIGSADSSFPGKLVSVSNSQFIGIKVEIPSSELAENHVSRTSNSPGPIDLAFRLNDDVAPMSSPTTSPRTVSQNKTSPTPSPFSPISHAWTDGLVSGPKKPRTRVSYTLPSGEHRQQHKGIAHKRIRRTNDKKTVDSPKSVQINPESLQCDANVLITCGDKGWRESGATIVIETVDREWRLAVKLFGITKYSYKTQQFLQPGSTNRYSHAMMWRGGKDWVLEFPDRSQWVVFKEMHEECYNQNIRSALVKNIPIPGVHLIEEMNDGQTEVAFVRSSTKYFRQGETDVDMVLNSSRILYDMDSDDERWISKNQDSLHTGDSSGVISDELFENAMYMFEKAAYTHQRDQFTVEEMEEFLFGVGAVDVIQKIYEYWRQKRERKGMPLIRQLQPPLWERYQKQLKEYESTMAKTGRALIEKPLMAAFCLKPRGLEVPNKGSKQRSHQRKLPSSGMNNISGGHDAYHPFGRRTNGFAFGEERDVTPHIRELTEPSRSYSPRETGSNSYFSESNGRYNRNYNPKHHQARSTNKRARSPNDSQYVPPFSHRNGSHQRWKNGYADLDGSARDEFKLRDASGSAQHARNMSKLKRERAQRLLYRADLAIHKAAVALMAADAIKASANEDRNEEDRMSHSKTTAKNQVNMVIIKPWWLEPLTFVSPLPSF